MIATYNMCKLSWALPSDWLILSRASRNRELRMIETRQTENWLQNQIDTITTGSIHKPQKLF